MFPPRKLERAAAFAGEVRHIQSTSKKKKFSGGSHLPPESQRAIAAAVNAAVTGKGGKVRVVRCLLEQFEELCRRRKCDIDAELRVALGRVLAGELAVNHAALGGSALKLIGLTVLQGAIGPDLVREFQQFHRHAVGLYDGGVQVIRPIRAPSSARSPTPPMRLWRNRNSNTSAT